MILMKLEHLKLLTLVFLFIFILLAIIYFFQEPIMKFFDPTAYEFGVRCKAMQIGGLPIGCSSIFDSFPHLILFSGTVFLVLAVISWWKSNRVS